MMIQLQASCVIMASGYFVSLRVCVSLSGLKETNVQMDGLTSLK